MSQEDTALSWKLPGLRGRRQSETSDASSQQAGEPLPAVPPDDSCLGRQSLGSEASRCECIFQGYVSGDH